MIYLIKWALALTILYSFYGLTLRRETLHTLNRTVLVIILVTSPLLPLCPVQFDHETWLSQGFERLETVLTAKDIVYSGQTQESGHTTESTDEANFSVQETRLQPLFQSYGTIILNPLNNHSKTLEQLTNLSVFPWRTVLLWFYILGTVACWLAFLRSLYGVMRLIRRSCLIEERDGVRILACPELRNSCSWMRWVLLAEADGTAPSVLTHELAHVRLGHSWDKLLAEATCRTLWFLPFAWMLREDLSDVHEYEADRAVLLTGIDIREYNQLLILKAVRPGLQPVVNAFNKSKIKKRITMMFKKKSNKWAAAKALYLLPVMVLALVAFAKPKAEPLLVPNEKALSAVDDKETANASDEKLIRISKDGDYFIVTWPRGTWVQNNEGSYIEERHPNRPSPLLRVGEVTVQIDGQERDIHQLLDKPASIVKKVELDVSKKTINIVTTPVQIPADVKGNINPVLTVLLTGTPPKGNPIKSSIYIKEGLHDSFDWKRYQYTSWTAQSQNIGECLEEIAYRQDHFVRVNACRGVPPEHIVRIKRLMQENGITHWDLVKEGESGSEEPKVLAQGRTYKLDFNKPANAGTAKKLVALDPSVLLLIDGAPASQDNWHGLAGLDLGNVIITEDEQGNIVQVNLYTLKN